MLLLRFDPEQPLTLGAIFNITTGVIEDRYGSTYVKDNKERKVWFLHMGDMDSINQKINFEELEENERRLYEKREARAAFKPMNYPLERNELRIHENKFLQTSDYLISCRGKTIGYSMKDHEHNENNQIIHKGSCILPTHHFLVLRPRSASLQDIEYLHFVLDMYVEHVLSVEKSNKNILSKGDIESREIKMIYNQAKQEEFVKILKGLKEEARLVQDKISFHLRNYTDTMDSNTNKNY